MRTVCRELIFVWNVENEVKTGKELEKNLEKKLEKTGAGQKPAGDIGNERKGQAAAVHDFPPANEITNSKQTKKCRQKLKKLRDQKG